jgi:hypothetical protein
MEAILSPFDEKSSEAERRSRRLRTQSNGLAQIASAGFDAPPVRSAGEE